MEVTMTALADSRARDVAKILQLDEALGEEQEALVVAKVRGAP